MNYIALFLGMGIVLAGITDLIYTTFSPNGAGFFTNAITKGLYEIFRRVFIRTNFVKLFESAGVIIIVLVLSFWYLSVWLGSSLIICSDPNSVVNSTTKASANIVEKFYYTGFTLSTLGVGDFKANSNGWRIFTVFLSFAGFVLITTGISYMLPVLSATVSKRKLGSYIAMLGASPQDVLQRQWHNNGFDKLESHFNSITEMILQHNQQLLAYPVIYCFYSANPRKSAALNIAKLDEVLTILLSAIPPENRPNEQSIYPLREAIMDYLIIQKKYFIKLKTTNLQFLEPGKLEETGIPLKQDYQDDLRKAYNKLKSRRELMGAILKDQGRGFSDIYRERSEYELEL